MLSLLADFYTMGYKGEHICKIFYRGRFLDETENCVKFIRSVMRICKMKYPLPGGKIAVFLKYIYLIEVMVNAIHSGRSGSLISIMLKSQGRAID